MLRRWILFALVLIHLAGIFSLVISPGTLLSDAPFTQADYPIHIYRAISWSLMARSEHSLVGYDPYWMAGYPIGVSAELLDNKPTSWFILAFWWLNPYRAYKIYIFLTFILMPVIIFYAAANLGTRKKYISPDSSLAAKDLQPAVLSVILAMDFWYLDPDVRYPIQYGSANLVLAGVIAPLVAALFAVWSENEGRGRRVWVVLPLAFLVHGVSPVIYLPILAFAFIGSLPGLKRYCPYIVRIALLALIVVIVNAIWWVPFIFKTMPLLDKLDYPFHQTQGWRGLFGLFRDVYKWLRPLLIVFGAWGIARWWRDRRPCGVCFGGTAIFLFILCNFGSSLGLSFLQPRRFWSAFGFLMTLPAGFALGALISRIETANLIRSKSLRIGFAITLAMPMIYTAFLRPWIRPIFSTCFARPPHWIEIKIPPYTSELTEWVEKNITKSDRILIETYYDRDGEESAFQALMPLLWNREMVGGPWPFPWKIINYDRVSFDNGILMCRPVEEYSPEDIKSLFTLYDIRYAFVFSPKARNTFSMQQWLEPLATPDPFYAVYADRRPSKRFIRGSGRISPDFGSIRINNASPNGIVIRYHWIPGLKTVPTLPVKPFPVASDPIGFIEVQNGEITDFYIK